MSNVITAWQNVTETIEEKYTALYIQNCLRPYETFNR